MMGASEKRDSKEATEETTNPNSTNASDWNKNIQNRYPLQTQHNTEHWGVTSSSFGLRIGDTQRLWMTMIHN